MDGTKPGLEGLFAGFFGDEAASRLTSDDAGFLSGANALSASSSPIQRTVTSLEAFTIQQAIRLRDPGTGAPRSSSASSRGATVVLGRENGTPHATKIDLHFENVREKQDVINMPDR